MSGDSAEGGEAREDPSPAFGDCPAYSILGNVCDRNAGQHGLGVSADVAPTLNAVDRHAVCYPVKVNTIPARMDGSPCIDRGPPVIAVYDARGNGDGEIAPTITGDHKNRITDYTAIALSVGNGQLNQMSMEPTANTLDTMHDQQAVLIAYSPDLANTLKAKANLQFREDSETYIVAAVDCRNGTINQEINGILQAKEQGYNLNSNNVVLVWLEVRRLMPIECERLQGYPDGWTDLHDWTDSNGKKRKDADTPRYKACGNSIALPFWFWLLRRISAQYERPATLGSLFDGIGGFPLCWERCNGPGTALWASEIEEFAIAVTKKHFPEDENDGKPMR